MDNNHIELTDAVIRSAALPQGKKHHLLHDAKVAGLALRMRDSGGRSWVYLHRKPGDSGTKKHTIGAWPKTTVENARKSATIIAADLIKRTDGGDPTEDKKAARQAAKQRAKMVTLAQLILNDPVTDQPGPYEKSLLRRQVVNIQTALSALRRGLAAYLKDDICSLTRLGIMEKVNAIADTGRLGAAKDLRKHTHTFLEWCVSEGYVAHNVLAGYRQPKATRAERIGRRRKGRVLSNEEIVKVWHAASKSGAFGRLVQVCLLGGPRRSEPARIEWSKHVLPDRVTFDENWTKMGLHHDIPRTPLLNSVLDAAKYFQRATSDLVFPSPKSGGQISGWTKMVDKLIDEASIDKFTLHDLRRTLRTIMSRCGYDDEIQKMCVGQKPRTGIDEIYNHDEKWIIRRMAFDAAHDYIAELIGAPREANVVRLFRNPVKNELLERLKAHHAAIGAV